MQEVSIQAPFNQWFTADGFFVAKPFQQWLASSVPLIGEADPKNVLNEKDALDGAQGNVETRTVRPDGVSEALGGIAAQAKSTQSKSGKRKA